MACDNVCGMPGARILGGFLPIGQIHGRKGWRFERGWLRLGEEDLSCLWCCSPVARVLGVKEQTDQG